MDELYSISEAKKRLTSYLARGIIRADPICLFYSQVRKVVSSFKYRAAVVHGYNGITLICQAKWILKAPDNEIDFVLSHELIHVMNLHFIRGYSMIEKYNLNKEEFYSRYAIYADLPTNYALKSHIMYDKMDMFTYKTMQKKGCANLTYDDYPTYESIVKYMIDNPDKNIQPQTVYIVDENGTIQNDNSTSTSVDEGDEESVIVIPSPSNDILSREIIEHIKDIVYNVTKSSGSGSCDIQDLMKKFLHTETAATIKGWNLLKQLLTGKRRQGKTSSRSWRRLNRKTLLPNGKLKNPAFEAIFIIDESGSMSEEELSIAWNLLKHAILQKDRDKIHVIHWDTEPYEKVDTLRNSDDLKYIERKKQGGTCFEEFFTHRIVRNLNSDLLIIITDGYPSMSWPKGKPHVPVVWIITTTGGYNNWKKFCNKGIAVCVDNE